MRFSPDAPIRQAFLLRSTTNPRTITKNRDIMPACIKKETLMLSNALSWLICTALFFNAAFATAGQKERRDYSDIIKEGAIQKEIFHCIGGHLIMSIHHGGREYKFTHSHGETFETGDFISAPIDAESKRMITTEAVLLTEHQERLLIQKIRNSRIINPDDKDEHIQRIIKFSKYKKSGLDQSIEGPEVNHKDAKNNARPANDIRPASPDIHVAENRGRSNEELILRWRQKNYTPEDFTDFITVRAQEHAEKTNAGDGEGPTNLYARERLQPIFDQYQEGDEIWSYHNGLFDKRMGRQGFALFRNERLVLNVTLLMN